MHQPKYIYLDYLKHENLSTLNFSESVEMPIDIPRVPIRDLDRLVASVPSPSLLYVADGTGGASSSLLTLVVSLPTVATNEAAEISLPPVASLLPAVSLPTVATDSNLQSATIATTSGSAGPSSNEGPRSLAISDSLVNNCNTETRIDHHVDDNDDDNDERASQNSYHTIDGLDETSSSGDDDFEESSRSRKKSKKRSRSFSGDRRGNSKKPTSQRSNNNRE